MRAQQLGVYLLAGGLFLSAANRVFAGERVEPADAAYSGADSTNPVVLPGLVVESDRLPFSVWEYPSAITVVDRTGRDRFTAGSTDIFLSTLPGLRSYPAGNEWGQSVVDVRGFYGGGQSQYLLVRLDGIPINNMSSGLVNWPGVTLADIGRAELLRGPVSSEYGDFGIGGLVSFYTPITPAESIGRFSLLGGSDDAYGYEGECTETVGGTRLRLSSSIRRNPGWRRHSEFRSGSALLTLARTWSGGGRANGLVTYTHVNEEIPGALTADAVQTDRTAVAADFMGRPIADRRDNDYFTAGANLRIPLSSQIHARALAHANASWSHDTVTTTQRMSHVPRTVSIGGELSLNQETKVGRRDLRLQVGAAAESGELRTRYVAVEEGGKTRLSEGSGTRTTISGFAKAALYPSAALVLTGGIRFDYMGTRFTWDGGAAVAPGDTQRHTDTRISPSAGASLRISDKITAFASLAGAFKAPTLIHLYDSPPFGMYVPEMNQVIYMLIANRNLKPMKGTHAEVGTRWRNLGRFEGSLNVYNYWVNNEIDFDLATLSYQNIGRSRHTGVEITLARPVIGRLRAEGSLAYTESVVRSDPFKGNQINGVPRWSYRIGASYAITNWGTIGSEVHGISRQYLDETDDYRIRDYAVADLQAAVAVSYFTLTARVLNILDREYEYDGYTDPLLMGAPRYYPAPGRQFLVTLTGGF